MMWSTEVPTDVQIEQVAKLYEENLRQGAIGIGITPGYAVMGET